MPKQPHTNEGSHFTKTRWTTVVEPAGDRGPRQREALERLLRIYYQPLLGHLRRKFRFSPEEASDILQGFVADKVLEYGLVERADRNAGRFRGFLVLALDRYALNTRRRASSRPTVSIDATADLPEAGGAVTPEFDHECDTVVIQEVVRRMKDHYAHAGKQHIWGVFSDRVVEPALQGSRPPAYDELVRKWGLKTPSEAYNALANAKRMFVQFRKEVAGE